MGLGGLPVVSLVEAREAAEAARKLRAKGVDPIADREALRAKRRAEAARAVTFRHCAERCIAARKDGWKSAKHAAQWSATLDTYAHPTIGELPVQTIDAGLVHKVLEPIWATKTETASRLRGRIEAVLDWATARGYRTGDNPARWKGHLENLFSHRSKVKKVVHFAAMPYREVSAFMATLKAQDGAGARALQFTILTGARTGETIGARWNELDLAEGTWTIPGVRMKGGRVHRVPLSKAATTILRRQKEEVGAGGFVFPGAKRGRHASNMVMLQTLRRMGLGHFSVHGFRSTFRDWAAECTSYPREVAEAALAHAVGDKVEAAYRRGDLFEKRRKLMNAWAAFCGTPTAQAKVIPIRQGAS